MKISLVAWTEADLNQVMDTHGWLADDHTSTAEDLLEAAGRVSYGSWSKPNPNTATNATYLANLIWQGHTSIFEHVTATFWVREVSRNMLLELERHRHTSYSVRSQRYVDERLSELEIPADADEYETGIFLQVREVTRAAYADVLEHRKSRGHKGKKAHQAARGILPGATHTEFFVTANLRAWRYIIALRATEHADPEIREFANQVGIMLQMKFPNAFQDLKVRRIDAGSLGLYFEPENPNV